jgi:hypothetical protein
MHAFPRCDGCRTRKWASALAYRGQARSYRGLCFVRRNGRSRSPVAAWLAGGGAHKIASAGKPDCYGSWDPRIGGVPTICCRCTLARDAMAAARTRKWASALASRGQARSYRGLCFVRRNGRSRSPVAARLAGGGAHKIAAADTSDATVRGTHGLVACPQSVVGARLPAMRWLPHQKMGGPTGPSRASALLQVGGGFLAFSRKPAVPPAPCPA